MNSRFKKQDIYFSTQAPDTNSLWLRPDKETGYASLKYFSSNGWQDVSVDHDALQTLVEEINSALNEHIEDEYSTLLSTVTSLQSTVSSHTTTLSTFQNTLTSSVGTKLYYSNYAAILANSSGTSLGSVTLFDSDSEEYLTMSSSGIKLSGINDALSEITDAIESGISELNTAISTLTSNLSTEESTRETADLKLVASAKYDADNSAIYLYNTSGTVLSTIDASDFIVDGMLESAEYVTIDASGNAGNYIHLVFNTDAGSKEIYVDVSDLVDVYTAGDGIAVTDNVVSVVKSSSSEDYLIVDENGVAITGIDSAISTLQGSITDEATARNEADTELQEQITSNDTDIAALQAADTTLQGNIEALQSSTNTSLVARAEYSSSDKAIYLYSSDETILSTIDATDFIKDGMVSSVTYDSDTKSLTISFNTDAGSEDITVDISDLVDTYTGGDGISITDNIISVVKSESSEDYLTISEDGIAVSGIDNAISAAISDVQMQVAVASMETLIDNGNTVSASLASLQPNVYYTTDEDGTYTWYEDESSSWSDKWRYDSTGEYIYTVGVVKDFTPTSLYRTFSGQANLTSVDLNKIDASQATTVRDLFYKCASLTSVDLSDLTFPACTTAQAMFSNCTLLEEVTLSETPFTVCTNLSYMFEKCYALESVNTSGWDTSSVTTLQGAFYGCSSLTSLDTSGWDTSSVTTLDCAFYGCSSLTSLDTSGWDTSSVTTLYCAFYGCKLLEEISIRVTSACTNINIGWNICACERIDITGGLATEDDTKAEDYEGTSYTTANCTTWGANYCYGVTVLKEVWGILDMNGRTTGTTSWDTQWIPTGAPIETFWIKNLNSSIYIPSSYYHQECAIYLMENVMDHTDSSYTSTIAFQKAQTDFDTYPDATDWDNEDVLAAVASAIEKGWTITVGGTTIS